LGLDAFWSDGLDALWSDGFAVWSVAGGVVVEFGFELLVLCAELLLLGR
jgi:hypothetical protein